MSLSIVILTVAGTLANGRERLVSRSFPVSPSRDFTRDLAGLMRIEDALADLDEGDVQGIEIDPASLLGLEINTGLNMVNGECFDRVASAVAELASAQEAARAPNARVMIESGL